MSRDPRTRAWLPPRSGLRGFTVVEVLVSVLIGLAVISLGHGVLVHQRPLASRLGSEMDLLSARRLAAVVIGKELRAGVRGRDWVVSAPDRLSLRAFRGWGLVCGLLGERGDIVVAYQGERAANPAKDSVLVMTADGWHQADLTRRAERATPCTMDPDVSFEVWTLDPPVPGALVARVFERGSYHVTGGALRYRRGLGGRQPLTLDLFDDDRSTMEAWTDGVLVRLIADESRPDRDGTSATGSATLRFWAPETR